MAVTKRHIGFGKWVIEADGQHVAGPMSKDDAEAYILSPPVPPKPAGDGDAEYRKRMYADLRKPLAEALAEIRPIVLRLHDQPRTEMIMRQIEGLLKSGGRRPGRHNVMLPAKPVAQAAA